MSKRRSSSVSLAVVLALLTLATLAVTGDEKNRQGAPDPMAKKNADDRGIVFYGT